MKVEVERREREDWREKRESGGHIEVDFWREKGANFLGRFY